MSWLRHIKALAITTAAVCSLFAASSVYLHADNAPVSGKQYVLKFATLAPPGTTWVKLLEEWSETLRTESNGRLVLKIYPGGVQGDEPDVLKKIRFGQLHGGAFTGYGLGHIYSPVRVLELPFLFSNIDEIDYVRHRFMPQFEQGFRDNGFELLGWLEVGFIYFFSKKPVYSLDDLRKRRIWHWKGDPLGAAFFKASGLASVPLSIMDVYTSLSTGLVDTVYTPPLGALALQWNTKTSYISSVPMANGIGSLLVSRKFFQNLPQDLQKILRRSGRVTGEKLVTATRKDNAESLAVLEKTGMAFVLEDEGFDLAEMTALSKKAGESLVNNGYIPKSTMERTIFWINEYNAKKAQGSIDAPG